MTPRTLTTPRPKNSSLKRHQTRTAYTFLALPLVFFLIVRFLPTLLALRMSEGRLRSDTLVSASIESEFASDGTPQTVTGTVIAEGGSIGSQESPVPITGAEFGLDWDIDVV